MFYATILVEKRAEEGISIQNAAEADLHTAAALENACFAMAFASEDQKEGMRAFPEKRKPECKGK